MSIQEILKAADGANIMLSVTPSDLKEFALTIIEETMNNIATSEVGHEDFMRDLMSQRETRKKLDVTNSTLWRWDKEKYLCPVKIGRKNFYKKSDIDKIIGNKAV